MHPKLRDVWTTLQKAETMLFRAAAMQNMEQFRSLYEGVSLEEPSRGYLIRMLCGFDPQNLSARDYQVRYPFSSVEAIQAELETLVASGHAEVKGTDHYAATEPGVQMVRLWMQRVSALMQSLDLGDILLDDVHKFLDYDRRILEAMKSASRPHSKPIFNHRMRGLHPEYDPPLLWHHWQMVWSMLAASEDEEDYLRQQRGIDPLVWFARRQVWFIHRRPWRARIRNLDDLASRVQGYSPLAQADQASAQAVEDLQARAWIETVGDEFRLTAEGLAACDEDERQIDQNFLSWWPQFKDEEIEEILDLSTRLNNRFLLLCRQAG